MLSYLQKRNRKTGEERDGRRVETMVNAIPEIDEPEDTSAEQRAMQLLAPSSRDESLPEKSRSTVRLLYKWLWPLLLLALLVLLGSLAGQHFE